MITRVFSKKRPRYVMESREDEIYHELRVGKLSGEPEYCAFLEKVWVFNRVMQWLRTKDNNIICYCKGGNLPLTGTSRVSSWFSDPENIIEEEGSFTHFVKKSKKRRRDCIVLPTFQFNIDQHPKIELTVCEVTDDWQFCVFVKGRSGPPVICSDWKRGDCNLTFDIKEALERKGYKLHFAELHFVLGIWNTSKEATSSLKFSLNLCGEPSIVPCLPVIRTVENINRNGLPVAAMVLDKSGECLRAKDITVCAVVNSKRFFLKEKKNVWTARINGLKAGNYEIELVAEGAIQKSTMLNVRVTDGNFLSYDKTFRSLVRSGKPTGPLSGSYQGMFPFKDAGLPKEEIVQGQKMWDAWDRTKAPGEYWHYWEALTEKELDQRFAYLKKCGWNLLHLCQHWGIWKRLDAGGRIAPHGAEQLALYLRLADRYGLMLLQALSHYPYGGEYAKPFIQYYEAGYKDEDWTNTSSKSIAIFREYLKDFTILFKEETALFAMSTSGEGDIRAGADRVNDTFKFVTSLDKNHIFLAEPIFRMEKLPHEHCKGWQPQLYGSRMYWIGEELKPEFDLGIEFKFLQLGHTFMGEGSWPCPPKYAKSFGKSLDTWTGTRQYRNRLRDSLYLGLINRSPIILTWDEMCTEDERIVFNQVRQLVNWKQPFMESPVAIRVDNSNVLGEGRKILYEYEQFFVSMPLECQYTITDAETPAGAKVVIDARKPFQMPSFKSEGGILPDVIKEYIPLKISRGYSASYLWSEDKNTLLAYIYNSSHYINFEQGLGGKIHRMPVAIDLAIGVQNLPSERLKCRVYDLNDKKVIEEKNVCGSMNLDLGRTDKDYFVLITPLE